MRNENTPNHARRAMLGGGGALAAVAGLSLIEQAHAQAATSSKLQEVLKRGKLIVGTGTTNPPWHFEDDSGNKVGMDIDAVSRATISVTSASRAVRNSARRAARELLTPPAAGR